MYPKILVPLDGSVEAETTVSRIQEELSSDGTIILLQVIPPAKGLRVGEHTIQTTQQEEANRATSLAYLRSVAEKQSIQPKKWHFEVAVSDSVAEEIANVALRERADLVAMFARDRRGIITRLLPGSLSEKVKDKVPIEVRTFSPDELRATGPHIGG